MAVFYNSETGQYDVESQSLNPLTESAFLVNEARLHTGTGWHEYSTVAAMNAAVAANHWPTPQQNNNPATAAAQQAAGVASHAVNQVTTGWTHNIEQWIIRGFEMLLGLGLIIVSLAKLASDTPVGKAAIKVGAKAALL